MSLKAKLEAIIYAAETPVTLDQLIELVKESVISEGAGNGTEVKPRVRLALEELIADSYSPDRGIEIRQVAGGYRMSTKPEHHDVVRAFAKSLKPPVRLSLPALETLAVIAYKQPVTVPEISEIRGVDSNGVIATLLDRKLITTAGRKAVIGKDDRQGQAGGSLCIGCRRATERRGVPLCKGGESILEIRQENPRVHGRSGARWKAGNPDSSETATQRSSQGSRNGREGWRGEDPAGALKLCCEQRTPICSECPIERSRQ